MLLTAMFMASCYWPPVPLDTPLSIPWSDNITTFGEALLSRMPNLPHDMVPDTVPIADRCWCDLSMGFFDPFNTTQWELNSVDALKASLEKQLVAKKIASVKEQQQAVAEQEDAGEVEASRTTQSMPSTPVVMSWQQKLGLSRAAEPSLNASSKTPSTQEPLPSPTQNQLPHATPLGPECGVLREYDLSRYGIDMVVDLRWPRTP